MKSFWKLFWACFVVGIFFITLSLTLGWCNDTAKVVKQEFSTSALLKKYMYFKDLSSAIDAKRADIKVYEDGKFYNQTTLEEIREKLKTA